MFGWAIDKMTIWKSVQQVGAGMDLFWTKTEEPRVARRTEPASGLPGSPNGAARS